MGEQNGNAVTPSAGGRTVGFVGAFLYVLLTFVLSAISFPFFFLCVRRQSVALAVGGFGHWVYRPAFLLSFTFAALRWWWPWFWCALYVGGILWNARIAAAQAIRIWVNEGKLQVNDPAWKTVVKENTPDGLSPELITAIKEVIGPCGISARIFFDNYLFLETEGEDWRVPNGHPKPVPIPSVLQYQHFMDRPPGHATWFLAAFPDVAQWIEEIVLASDEQEADARVILEDFYSQMAAWEATDLHDAQGTFTPKYAKLLVATYRTRTGRPLQCALLPAVT